MRIQILDCKIEIESSYIIEEESEIRKQINEYLQGQRQSFELEIEFPESFLGQVMKQMNQIPYGETRTYGEIAEKIDTAPIAVGQACSKNPVPIVVPCHRVVSVDSLGGYRYGQEVKKKLLDLEVENSGH